MESKELDDLDKKILNVYPGLVVRKDLASTLKGAYPVPTYVLEFLLGRYCSNPNEEVINAGLKKVKTTLEGHYLNPERVEVVKSKIREIGMYQILDRLKVRLVPSEDKYWGMLVTMGLDNIHIDEELVHDNERLLLDGVWGISTIGYDSTLSHRGKTEPFILSDFKPVQLSSNLADRVIEKRDEFTKEEWIQLMLRSIGLEPSSFTSRQQMLLILRLVAFVERNVNYVEFGPRSTGKSFSYRELSPHSILISGGGTSIANLFVSNVGSGKPGLVTYFDLIAFDEVAGLSKFRDSEELQIFKDYMESGTFSRGKGEFTGKASLVFVGNMDTDIQTAIKTQHLFIPFPPEMQDLAFLDRFHIYLPGWELPRFKPKMFTKNFGFIVDLIAEFFQTMRNKSFISSIDEKIDWGKDVDQRDKVRVRTVASGLIKLLYPNGKFTEEDIAECVELALESRRRVKEQLRRMGSVEFRKTNLSYITKSSNQETFVTTPEMELAHSWSPLENINEPGIAFTIGLNSLGNLSLYRIEVGLRKGRGTWNATGLAGKPIKEALITVRDFLKANLKLVKPEIPEHDVKNKDVHVQIVDLMQAHQGSQTGLGFFVSVVSKFLKMPIKQNTIIVGEMTISGALIPIQNIAEIILIGKECGAERILLPDNTKPLLSLVPDDIKEDINLEFFSSPIEAWDLAKGTDIMVSETDDEGPADLLEDTEIENPVSHEPIHNFSEEPELDNDNTSLLEEEQDDLTEKITFIIDGSNVARNKQNSKEANIQDIYRCRKELMSLGIPKENIFIIFGSSIRHYVREQDKSLFSRLLKEDNVNQAPKGTDDDWFIIKFAYDTNSFIITNDYYTEYRENHPDLKDFIENKSIRYTCLGTRITFMEDIKKKILNK